MLDHQEPDARYIEQLAAIKRNAWKAIAGALHGVSPEDRLEFFDVLRSAFCLHCGHEQPVNGRRCQCNNDE